MHFYYLFDDYLFYEVLPEVVLLPFAKKQEILQGYFETVVKKVIVDCFKIKKIFTLKSLLKLMINSRYITVSKLYNNL